MGCSAPVQSWAPCPLLSICCSVLSKTRLSFKSHFSFNVLAPKCQQIWCHFCSADITLPWWWTFGSNIEWSNFWKSEKSIFHRRQNKPIIRICWSADLWSEAPSRSQVNLIGGWSTVHVPDVHTGLCGAAPPDGPTEKWTAFLIRILSKYVEFYFSSFGKVRSLKSSVDTNKRKWMDDN